MTEEQIRQNAEEYARKVTISNSKKELCTTINDFIAGAHSRDEEVEKLKKKLEDITKLKNSFASSLDIYDKDNKELQDELKTTPHPWISVEERLPEKYKLVLVKTGRGKCYLAEKDNFAQSRDEFALPQLSSYVDGVTHWMPIP